MGFQVNANTFVFGGLAADGAMFKMASYSASGALLANKWTTGVANINCLTVAKWNSGQGGAGYSVKNLVKGSVKGPAVCSFPVKGTFLDNQGTQLGASNQVPFQVNANTFVFGGLAADGAMFKMASYSASGALLANKWTTGVKNINCLTVAKWNAGQGGA